MVATNAAAASTTPSVVDPSAAALDWDDPTVRERILRLARETGPKLASLPAAAAQALRDRAREAISAYETPGGVEFRGVTLLAAGRRA